MGFNSGFKGLKQSGIWYHHVCLKWTCLKSGKVRKLPCYLLENEIHLWIQYDQIRGYGFFTAES